MATSKILLGLIAFSSFQVQNARCDDDRFWSGHNAKKVPHYISDSFRQAVDRVKEMYTDDGFLAKNKLKVLRIAIVKLDEFYENMDRIETQANSEIQRCKPEAAAALGRASGEMRNLALDCFKTHENETIEAVDIAMKTLLSKKFYMARLEEQFQACENDECGIEVVKQADIAVREQNKLLNQVIRDTLKTNAWLLANFRKGCLTKREDEYQDTAKYLIEDFKTISTCDIA